MGKSEPGQKSLGKEVNSRRVGQGVVRGVDQSTTGVAIT